MTQNIDKGDRPALKKTEITPAMIEAGKEAYWKLKWHPLEDDVEDLLKPVYLAMRREEEITACDDSSDKSNNNT